MFPQVETNLSLFEKTPCIRPVWDPGSPSGLVLTCLGSTDGRRREDGEIKEMISWTKVCHLNCMQCENERERERRYSEVNKKKKAGGRDGHEMIIDHFIRCSVVLRLSSTPTL